MSTNIPMVKYVKFKSIDYVSVIKILVKNSQLLEDKKANFLNIYFKAFCFCYVVVQNPYWGITHLYGCSVSGWLASCYLEVE